MRRSSHFVSIGGRDVSSIIDPYLLQLTIKLTAMARHDSAEIELDDAEGRIALPSTGASVEAGIGWEGGRIVQFEGEVDQVTSLFSRGGGTVLRISANAAEQRGKLKQRMQKHHDKGNLSAAATKFGQAAGLSVKVEGSIASIERDYWSMSGETFSAWGARIAREIGATFRVMGKQAVFVPRNGGISASGRGLTSVSAAKGVNIISSSLSPVENTPEFQKAVVRWYDRKKARWQQEEVGIKGGSAGVSAERNVRWSAPDKGQAKNRAESNEKDSDRERGGGSVEIDGEPGAVPEGTCVVSGVRPGIDGTYRIESVDHKLSRGAGFTTSLELKQPAGGAGTDSR